ncbi:MAG: tRNA uridine-5-carboxymethylaminomethyl(34) synthesis GTPase MnmE [Campylobacteraceae bacterium]|nr:tRNA uridine-5-carboxymethylaminomethyl(34) synthesis GTPase MnmE [Campylobacteraceae bacterium]
MYCCERFQQERKIETITAIATAHGVGSIAVVRVSGVNAYDIALKLSRKIFLTPRVASLSYIYDEKNQTIDQSIIIYFKAPNSYTAEDVVEFQCHGGIRVANLIMNEVLKLGARVANPGEFTKRAFLNGRIDLSEAEAIQKLIEAKSDSAIKMLSRHLRGELKNFIENARDELLEIISYIEVAIDYAEEDLPQNIEEQIYAKLEKLTNSLEKILKNSKQRDGLLSGFKISIIGKPNVGKSSLLNKLLEYDRAIVSDIAGTTRDTIEEEIKIGTHIVKIIDTAGIREAKDEIEKIGISRSFEAVQNSDIVFAMFDNSKVADREDVEIFEFLKKQEDKKIFYILNKNDLPNKFNRDLIDGAIELNCKEDTSALVERLEEFLSGSFIDDELMLSSSRQIFAVSNALELLKDSYELVKNRELELFAFNLNEAIYHLASITRPFERSEILDSMFSNFCLGK